MTLCCDHLVGTVRTQTHQGKRKFWRQKFGGNLHTNFSPLPALLLPFCGLPPRPAIISEKKNHKYVVTHRDPGSNVIKFDVEQNSNSFK